MDGGEAGVFHVLDVLTIFLTPCSDAHVLKGERVVSFLSLRVGWVSGVSETGAQPTLDDPKKPLPWIQDLSDPWCLRSLLRRWRATIHGGMLQLAVLAAALLRRAPTRALRLLWSKLQDESC